MNKKEMLRKYSYLFIVLCLVAIFYKVFDVTIFGYILNAFLPLIIGAVLAYFLQPLVLGLENRLDKSNNKWLLKHSHNLSSVLVFLLFILIIALFLVFLIPTVVNYGIHLAKNITSYVDEFEASMLTTFGHGQIYNLVIKGERMIIHYFESPSFVEAGALLKTISKTGSTMMTILIGLIFCPYVLIEAKKLVSIFDRFMLLFIEPENLNLIHEYAYRSHRIFGSFIYGKFIDSIIIGLIALVGFGLLGLKFFPLLAFIVFITNMIPYFGPFIGGIPVVFIALLTNGLASGIYSAIFIFALQQFDGLILGPAILGDTVGISPFWIICSITVFGNMFGFIGMFLGVPLICVIRMLFRDFIDYSKNKKRSEVS